MIFASSSTRNVLGMFNTETGVVRVKENEFEIPEQEIMALAKRAKPIARPRDGACDGLSSLYLVDLTPV